MSRILHQTVTSAPGVLVFALRIGLIALVACGGPEDGAPPATDDGCEAPTFEEVSAVTTLSLRVVRDGDPLDDPLDLNPAFPEGLAEAEALGLGALTEAPGEPWLLRDDGAPGHPADTGPDRRSLWMVYHQTDAQLADPESPTRYAATDLPGLTQSAARPQELHAIHALDALNHAANQLHQLVGVDFGLFTGDNIDNNQENELRAFLAMMDGGVATLDAGEPGDQTDESCQDPIAPFEAEGLEFPWYAAAGNHDVLVQGNFANDVFVDTALGGVADGGTRDLSEPGAPLAYATDPDPSRRLLENGDYAAILLESPDTPGPSGHGFTDANVADGTVGWAADPVAGVPVRLITVDANPPNVGAPELTAAERDGWLIPELERARADGVLVVVASHYALSGTAVEGGGTVGDLLSAYDNVVLVLAGHSHANEIDWIGPADASGFWQIVTASTIDWPLQARMVELVDNGDGTLSIYTTIFDPAAPPGGLAWRAMALAALDYQAGWRSWDGSGTEADRNTELVQRLPATWAGGVGETRVRSSSLP